MTTAPPNFKPILESAGFGEVDYFGVGKEQLVPDTVPQSWVEKERARRAASQMQQSAPDISDEYVNSTIEEMELAQNYPDLTADEWEKLHSKEDKAKGHFTLAEVQKMKDIQVKWVKGAGSPIAVESQNGVTAKTWQRGDLLVYSVTNADGTSQDWLVGAKTGLHFHLNQQGEIIRTSEGDDYQVMMQKTDNTLFVDCTRSAGSPNIILPIGGTVNNRKALVTAGIEPDGQIRIGRVRGAIKSNQFIVKLPTGAFATIDENGKPMLAQLDKLPKDIPLSEQDIVNHNAFAAQIANGKQALETFICEDTSFERQRDKIVFSEASKARSNAFFNHLVNLEKSGELANASSELFRTDKPPSIKYVDAVQRTQTSNAYAR